MKLCQVLLVSATILILSAWACPEGQKHNGCKISAGSCVCGYGCKYDYIYKTKRICREVLKESLATPPPPERNSNICSVLPCYRGSCLQTTANDNGFICKCAGTGFYGQRCEKACPTGPFRGMVFPHECIII